MSKHNKQFTNEIQIASKWPRHSSSVINTKDQNNFLQKDEESRCATADYLGPITQSNV